VTPTDELRAQVAQDAARARQWREQRDAARAAQDSPPVVGEDITPDGNLAGKYRIVGWKTRDESEHGTKLTASHPAVAGATVTDLLSDGHYQVIVEIH
jgi:hypothetical protein